MIKVENIVLPSSEQWGATIRGMRNPKNSWAKSDSIYCDPSGCGHCACSDLCEDTDFADYDLDYAIGKKDIELMHNLFSAGTEHRKFLRMLPIHMDITAPLYWWKEFDTYKVGTVVNSCSTMHKIHSKEFSMDDFSIEHVGDVPNCDPQYLDIFNYTINVLNEARHCYLDTKDKEYWWQMIQILPSSYNQKRTVMINYESATSMIKQRTNHKLDEWREFVEILKNIPYMAEITGETEE